MTADHPSHIVVVTGASGFVGQALVPALARADYQVIALGRQAAITELWPGLDRIRRQVVSGYDLADLPEQAVIIHLAEERDMNRLARNPEAVLAESEDVAVALAAKAARLVYASSMAVYGDQMDHPVTESDPVTAIHPYQRMKLVTERAVLAANGLCLRLTNLYGPGMATNNVLSDIIAQTGQTGPLTLRSLSPVRDYLWLDDCVEALVQAVETPLSGIVNIASGHSHSVRELAEKVLEIAGDPPRDLKETNPAPAGQLSRQYVSTEKARNQLNWQAETGLENGLAQLL